MRLPTVTVRGGENPAPVPDDRGRERRPRFAGARTAARWLARLRAAAVIGGGRLRCLWTWLPSWAFAAVTQAPALLAVAWLVPGTAILLAGRLLPLPMAIIFLPLAAALCYFAMRRLPVSWPRSGNQPEGGGAQAVALLAMLAIAAGFGVWQAFFRSEPVFVAGDPGVYLHYGYWIAEHGSVRIPESAAAFGGAPGLDFATTGFTVSGDAITPSYLPGLPLVLAGGTWLGGIGGALLMPAVLGGCAVLSFGGLVGRLCGAWWAVAGELVLALCLPEVYTSRAPFSEPLVQVLLFGGLCLFIDSLLVRERSRPGAVPPGDGLVLAGLGGLALGLTVLASIASLGLLLPAFPVLAVLFVARRPQAGPLGLGLFLGIGLGLWAGLALDRAYLSTVATQLRLIGLCAAGSGLLTALIAPLAFPGTRARVRRLNDYHLCVKGFKGQEVDLPSFGTLLAGLAAAVPAAILVGLTVRPYLQTVHGQADPAVIRHVALLQHLEGQPVDGRRSYAESSLYWVFWYLGVPGVLLACAGAAVLGWRAVRRALDGGPAALAAVLRLWGLPFVIIGWSVATVLWDPSAVPWQPLASHRLVPVVLPGLALLALWMSARVTSRAAALGASRVAVRLVGTCCVLALAIPPLVTTLNPALTARPSVGRNSSGVAKLASRVRLRGIGTSATYSGSLAAARVLCASIGPSASVVFVSPATAAAFAPVVRDLCGQPAALLVAPHPTALAEAVSSIEQIGRRPVFLGQSRSSVSIPGVTIRLAITLRTRGDAEILTGPPAGTWPATYSVWQAVPAGSAN
jgi:hypothetical protein